MGSIFQTKAWEELKLKTGYQKSYWVEGILILQKNLPAGRSLLYSPMVNFNQQAAVNKPQFHKEIERIAKENKSIFFRLELDIPQTTDCKLLTTNYKKAFEHMQPENTWTLNLEPSKEELLAQMSMRCRYNVKLAKKSGVTVTSSRADQPMLDNFYSLYSITGKRHGITFREKGYFKNLLEILGKEDYARIYEASLWKEQKAVILCSGILVFSGEKAIYMFGSSSNEYRNLKSPNLLVWQMILDAKKQGCKEFDFYGIAPTDDKKHPWAGITSFKKQFGGYQIDILGSYDLVFRPAEYQAFKLLEKIRR